MLAFFQKRRIRLQQENLANKRLFYVALDAVTILRDTVHSLGWSSHYSQEFSPFEPYIRTADAIGNALFNAVNSDFKFHQRDEIFSGRHAESEFKDFADKLSRHDVGTYNPLRDQLLERPMFKEGLDLMGKLLWFTMEGVHKNRAESLKILKPESNLSSA